MLQWDWTIKASDLIVAASTLCGAIAAVQVQKFVERNRDRQGGKARIFYLLMATRGNRLSNDHVYALNSIDLQFGERRTLFWYRQSKRDRAVTEAWAAYIAKLSEPQATDPHGLAVWGSERVRVFSDLMFAMSQSLGHRFTKTQIEKSAYAPQAHNDQEVTNRTIQAGLSSLVTGQTALKMNVVGFPFSQEAIDSQVAFQKSIASTVTPEGEIRIVSGGKPDPDDR
jgi:hypothetical protein